MDRYPQVRELSTQRAGSILRFAPSPTGSLHLGGLRTALYNHLFAKKYGGKWILRIEDTDAYRFVHGAVDNIRKSLEWAGLEYDYGPGVGGPHATYFQSERLDLYHYHANKLVESGHAYHCFCSPAHLGNVKETLARRGSNATYDKTCLHLSEEEVTRRKRAGGKFVIRLNDETPPTRLPPVDIIFGSLRDAHNSLPTDPILYKSDGFPTYHLASVVDDHEMGVTHVLRGEEWLPSLPLHLDLYACLGFTPPEFAHLPLLLNPDGSKMSKRKGDVSVLDYMEQGWMAPAVLNWLALAGWGIDHGEHASDHSRKAAPASTELFTMHDLIERFDLSVLTPRRSILDPHKLQLLNAKHIQRAIENKAEVDGLADRARSLVAKRFRAPEQKRIIEQLDFKNILKLAKNRLRTLNDLPQLLEFLFYYRGPSSTKDAEFDNALDVNRYGAVLNKYIDAIEETQSAQVPWDEAAIRKIEDMRDQRDELVLLRRALTGRKSGLPLITVMFLLGRDETLRRLSNALQWTEAEKTLREAQTN
ncbi:glutamyl-tRNA synthetase [Fomitiporia mediterranea MF3/22]|uniref:glutamyl-tRNA synthetase n=1 Tax=Fomitiporia mediterranea (strain MF3/22) TaxID=694068 RepID=UPI0004408D6F|nr:glutamyl-tRNA synthetase [Fomitiporia mediterranea MF3/22]EJD04563.1 glutamyl-tRNA synthetase [Fomitiporia mediterranea MF3/22]